MTGSQLLGGRYQFIQTLSSNQNSKTYLVADTFLDDQPRRVVRQLQLQGRTPKALRFILVLLKKKAEAIKHVGTHDQIPQIIECFEENSSFYLVEEYIEGRSLAEILKPGQRFSEELVRQLLQEILKILLVVHGWGVIHRSIKPSSIIQRHSDGKLVLTGFGVFKEISSQNVRSINGASPSFLNGASAYSPPEQAHGQRHFSHDIYAVGMIGIQALTGLSAEDLQQIKQSDQGHGRLPESLSWHSYAQASPQLAEVLDRMVYPQAKHRYRTVAEVLEDLRRLSDWADLPESAPLRSSEPEPLAAESSRHLPASKGPKRQANSERNGNRRATLGVLTLAGLALILGLVLLQVPQRLWAGYALAQGQKLESQGDEETAIAHYTRSISVFPSAEAYLRRGTAYYELEDWQMAQDDLSRVLEMDAAAALRQEAYYHRGNIRFALGDRPGAIEDYTAAIQIDSTAAAPYVNRGTVRAELGDDQGAIEDYSQAIQNDPNLAAAYLNRCLSRSNLGDHQGAIVDCVQASRIEPNSVAAFQNRGLVRRRLGDPAGAIEDFNIAINLDPQDADPYYNRGLARQEVGDRAGAIADYTTAIELNPTHALAFYDRGLAYWAEGDSENAIADLEKSAKLCLDAGRIDCYEDAQYQIQRIQESAQ